MAAVCHTAEHPKIWENSFRACNIHPEHRMPFPEWCKAIEPFMQASDSFDLVTQNSAVDFYKLLPAFWHGMCPSEKKKVMSVIERFGEDVWQVNSLFVLSICYETYFSSDVSGVFRVSRLYTLNAKSVMKTCLPCNHAFILP